MWQERRRYSTGYEPKAFNSDSDDSQAQRDRARIIHSASFRKLQSKTQVLGIGESDFYRTRLTHSMEVAQIGSGICEKLRENYRGREDYLAWIPSLSQIEAIGLAHDLGHPPFGHGGEVALNSFMYNHGGFEGNGQTLRIVSKLGEYSPEQGLDLTRRTMLGLLKYPVLHQEVADYAAAPSGGASLNIDGFKPPKCIHDDEADILAWLIAPLPEKDREQFRACVVSKQSKEQDKEQGKVQGRDKGKRKAAHKSFDTSIMELADDISYGVHDLEDALALKLVTFQQWQDEVINRLQDDNIIAGDVDFYNTRLFSECNKARKHAISRLIGYLIHSIEITEKTAFEQPLLRYQVTMSPQASALLDLLKGFVIKNVIKRPEVQVLEYKGQQMILRLFEVLQENPKRLLPLAVYQAYEQSGDQKRVICDYVAGMSDNDATKLYHKLFTPQMGSIFDRL
ncbi:deoxyguanosinetriphosphate triphosphohydrolase family protein [Thalassomonas viridans]|uniref:Deoxyguanosinetriphosphate triphosphohydrolase-like protein n=1 Tax=Thalassomonas viridans TaxID=137584 RepID=A0AAE9YZ76_9GAMM|nr:anti-phage deoxyguanosine triphosphatase [Thalassomonas viridans]WDE03700.1 deoxyguanosinetriphosphate triphosphohydrolase family protein [Thalassomonas viridans]